MHKINVSVWIVNRSFEMTRFYLRESVYRVALQNSGWWAIKVSKVKEEKSSVKGEEQKAGSIPLHALIMFVQYLEGNGTVEWNMKWPSRLQEAADWLNTKCYSISTVLEDRVYGVCNIVLGTHWNIILTTVARIPVWIYVQKYSVRVRWKLWNYAISGYHSNESSSVGWTYVA
jgi:hypothetical protein